jgi:hypothetical protein
MIAYPPYLLPSKVSRSFFRSDLDESMLHRFTRQTHARLLWQLVVAMLQKIAWSRLAHVVLVHSDTALVLAEYAAHRFPRVPAVESTSVLPLLITPDGVFESTVAVDAEQMPLALCPLHQPPAESLVCCGFLLLLLLLSFFSFEL